MLRADSFFGCRSNTPSEILTASRSWLKAGKACSCSAAARYFVAESSGSPAPNRTGRRPGIAFTVARCEAHPHNPTRSRAAARRTTQCHTLLDAELTISSHRLNFRRDLRHERHTAIFQVQQEH